jgi:MFS family permease
MTETGAPTAAAVERTKSGKTKLTSAQITGFLAAWIGWILDGMDSFIYALVLSPALGELLPKSGYAATTENIGFAGSIMFALFLIGWGMAFLWGPIADRFGRTRTLAATILVYSVFTGAAAFAQDVWQLAIFRLLAGVGVGGEWAIAGTYVAEMLPEDRRKFAGGLLNSGYYIGFFIASALNYTVGTSFGWRAMFLCGLAPVVVGLYTLYRVKEPERWTRQAEGAKRYNQLAVVFRPPYLKRTVVMTTLLSCSIIGLWAGSVYAPTAIRILSTKAGMSAGEATQMASFGAALLSLVTIVGNLVLPFFAERLGRRPTLALYFTGMLTGIVLAFGWAFYLPNGLVPFFLILVLLGLSGGNFAIYNIWLPEQYETKVRATAFAFAISFGRFVAAGVNFILAAGIREMGTLGIPIALTAVAFAIGLIVLPFSTETKGRTLPD